MYILYMFICAPSSKIMYVCTFCVCVYKPWHYIEDCDRRKRNLKGWDNVSIKNACDNISGDSA